MRRSDLLRMGRCAWFAITALVGMEAAAEESQPSALRLYAIDCGMMVTNGVHAADPCFLVRHPKGDLLWDTGLPQSMAEAPGGVSKIGQVDVTLRRKLTDSLAELSLTPADIEYLAISHSHFDHIGNAKLFGESVWIVDADEHAWAFREQARAGRGFAAYRELEGFRTRLIEGDDDVDVFGDGTVKMVQAPGHTPGHMVLLLRLAHAGPILLAGDLWNSAESRVRERATPQEIETLKRMESLIEMHRARVVRQHVLADFESLPKFPEFLD